MSELLLNFVVTFEYIPRPQRLALFKSLADKLGSEEFLFALLVILLDKYPNNATMLQFAAEIISKYDIRIQFLVSTLLLSKFVILTSFQMIEKYLSVILDTLKPKSMSSDSLVIDNVGFDAEHRVTNLLPFLTVILKSPSFVSKTQEILDREEDFVRTIRVIYEQVAKQAFILSTNSEDNEMSS